MHDFEPAVLFEPAGFVFADVLVATGCFTSMRSLNERSFGWTEVSVTSGLHEFVNRTTLLM